MVIEGWDWISGLMGTSARIASYRARPKVVWSALDRLMVPLSELVSEK